MSYQKITSSKVLVTGGAGFIGSNICEDLLKYNNEVICLDNFSTGREQNIISFREHPRFILINGDIRSLEDCRNAVRGVDIVLQQAALGSVPRSLDDPLTTNEVNVTGFLNMLVASRDERVKRFIYAASSSTYGDSTALPKREENIGQPLSPYAVTKYANELYAHVFSLNYGMKIIGLRYFNVFGKHQDPQGAYAAAIPRFIRLLIDHQPPLIHGDGTGTRDFTYVANVIQMNHLAAVTDNSKAFGEVFNTAVGKSVNLNALLSLLKGLLSRFDPLIQDVGVEYGPLRQGDIQHSLAAISKAGEMLNYRPEYSLAQGLEECIGWYWNNLRSS
jgi:UDP-N-acetylglucosamine 4-epimerase